MTQNSFPILNFNELPLEEWKQGEFFAGRDISIGARLGLKQLGISVNQVPPGKSGCPFHNHHVEDELFVIIAGSGEYRFGDRRMPVRPGDIIGAPAGGPETAHQLINTGSVTLAYIAVSTNAETEIVEYPDSGKFLARTRCKDGGFRFIGRMESHLDYWDGEPGSS